MLLSVLALLLTAVEVTGPIFEIVDAEIGISSVAAELRTGTDDVNALSRTGIDNLTLARCSKAANRSWGTRVCKHSQPAAESAVHTAESAVHTAGDDDELQDWINDSGASSRKMLLFRTLKAIWVRPCSAVLAVFSAIAAVWLLAQLTGGTTLP